MRDYELMVILSSRLEQKEQEDLISQIKKILVGLKAKTIKVNNLGLKNFSYPIKKELQGFYSQLNFSVDAKEISDLEKKLKANENFLRYLLIKTD